MSRLRRPLALAAVILAGACSDSTGPVSGTLKVNFTTPNNGQDAAVVLLLSAPAVPVSAAAAPGLTLWADPFTTPTAKLVLTGTLSSGTILTLQVDDVNKVQQYSVAVLQVSDAAFGRRGLLANYSATVTR